MKLTHTINLVEIVWTVTAILGLLYSTKLFLRSYSDLRWLVTSNANGYHEMRIYVAHTSILIFVGGCLTQAAYVAVGIIAMTQPSLHNHPTPASITTGLIFVLASITGTTLAAVIYSRRVKVIRIVHEKLQGQ